MEEVTPSTTSEVVDVASNENAPVVETTDDAQVNIIRQQLQEVLQISNLNEEKNSNDTPVVPVCNQNEIMKAFLEREKKLSMADYIKTFFDIRTAQDSLRFEHKYSSMSACNPVYFSRNRYRDILPYDYNRVVLSSSETNPNGYMNASHIVLPQGKTKFVAAQAPLPSTLDEWWQMIDEQNINLILMLCKLYEMSKIKCERYWPEQKGTKEIFGNYEITFEDEEIFESDDDYILRVLTMENQVTGAKRTVKQLHYREWPDHGCPAGEGQLLNMINKMAELYKTFENPVLVHCSAGVGRTGTIIAVNYVRELIEQNALTSLNIFDLVMSLRMQRASMVQTQDQYHFVHKCVARYCRKELGLPEPDPLPILKCTPVQAYVAPSSNPPPNRLDSSDDDSSDDAEVPDFPHEPPAPRGPEELGSAAS